MANLLFDRLFQTATPGSTMLVAPGETLTYAEANRRSARLARALVAAGVRPGDRVAVQVEKSVANLMLYLAAVRMGAIYLPLNTAYTPNEVGYFLGDAEPALAVCDPVSREALQSVTGAARLEWMASDGTTSLAALATDGEETFEAVQRGADDLAALCYTSGTTGRSKGAMLTHGNLVSNAQTLTELWRFTADDVLIHALPIYHVHGLFVATHVAMMAGAAMIYQPRFDADAVMDAMPHATSLMGVPTFYTRLLDHPALSRETASRMRLFISGSAPLLAQTHAAFAERTGHAILERYGMTETGMNTSNPYDGDRVAGTVGLPLPGVSVRVSATHRDIGGVEVKGPNVFKGYWNNPEKTAAEFTPEGYFMTGDLGVFDARGYLSIVGREKDLIISGGLNIYPKEIELEIDALPGVLESAVIGLPDADFGERVVAVVVAEPGAAVDGAEILTALAPRLARFKQPRHVVMVGALPRNAMGKVQKAALRERFADLAEKMI